jgi:urease accessory protein UreF
MPDAIQLAQHAAAQLLGDPHPLVRQLGSPDALVSLPLTASEIRVTDLPSLRRFLAAYRDEILVPMELPAIRRAHDHASRQEVRELLTLDHELAAEPRLRHFAAASRAVGRSQLHRLLPMRDLRLVRRYWQAAEAGEAQAWHVLVYGVVLAVFALPLRPGLVNYGRQTLGGFIESAAGLLRLKESDAAQLAEDLSGTLPAAVDTALTARGPLKLLAV